MAPFRLRKTYPEDLVIGSVHVPSQSSIPPLWTSEQLRLALDAAGVSLWSWNVDSDAFAMDERAFNL